ncbi:MAG TPA: DUF1049 domain-containing protein [Erysipelothrix sp.]|nr:DUF1049 domain-containing protein [Erysipelothrix sp.]
METENKPIAVEEPKKETYITFKQILLIILIIFILVFMMLNFNQVEVNLLFAKIQAPLVVVIFLSYILGSLITWLMNALRKDKE